jgi:hypothetical protein
MISSVLEITGNAFIYKSLLACSLSTSFAEAHTAELLRMAIKGVDHRSHPEICPLLLIRLGLEQCLAQSKAADVTVYLTMRIEYW